MLAIILNNFVVRAGAALLKPYRSKARDAFFDEGAKA
jgi:hypothetical protein